ncbi:MAG: DUF2911 domain-containing protein [Acidobacteriota bacterium]
MRRIATPGLLTLVLLATLAPVPSAQAQGITTPPGGDNQRSVITQYMGMVSVTIDYNSPDVHSPTGEDRTGKIWGGLVPYGMTNLGFGPCKECPWRAGANENTTFTVSHDVEVEGKSLAAGTYGLHLVAGEEEWTVIFSNNSTAWGSFFYDPAEDALRVNVKSEPAEYREWLTFDFADKQLASTTAAMHWEKLRVPFVVTVPNLTDLYVEKITQELQSSPGFTSQNWAAAANFVLQRDTENKHLDKALEWADQAINAPFGIGQKNFQNLAVKAQVLVKLGRGNEAQAVMAEAMADPTATPFQIHGYGRALVGQGLAQQALTVFQKNAERFPDTWPVNLGLARGYSAVGEYGKALEHAKKALANAPAPPNRANVEGLIKTLEEGKDIN